MVEWGPSPKKCRAEAREDIAMLSYNAVSWVLHNNPGFADVCFFFKLLLK